MLTLSIAAILLSGTASNYPNQPAMSSDASPDFVEQAEGHVNRPVYIRRDDPAFLLLLVLAAHPGLQLDYSKMAELSHKMQNPDLWTSFPEIDRNIYPLAELSRKLRDLPPLANGVDNRTLGVISDDPDCLHPLAPELDPPNVVLTDQAYISPVSEEGEELERRRQEAYDNVRRETATTTFEGNTPEDDEYSSRDANDSEGLNDRDYYDSDYVEDDENYDMYEDDNESETLHGLDYYIGDFYNGFLDRPRNVSNDDDNNDEYVDNYNDNSVR